MHLKYLYIWSYYNCTMGALSKLLLLYHTIIQVDSNGRELGGPVESPRDYVGAQAVIDNKGMMYFHGV